MYLKALKKLNYSKTRLWYLLPIIKDLKNKLQIYIYNRGLEAQIYNVKSKQSKNGSSSQDQFVGEETHEDEGYTL